MLALRKVFPRVRFVKYPEQMTMEKVKQVFLDQGEDLKLWQALDTTLYKDILDAMTDSADPKKDANELFHIGGRIDALTQLKFEIQELRKWKSGRTNYKQT